MKPRLQAWGDTKIIPIASCFVFSHEGKLLLLQRHLEDLGGGQWGTAGGRLDPGEDAHATVRRELFEETGLTSDQFELLGAHNVHMPHGTVHMTSYKLTLLSEPPIVIDPQEHHAYRWFELPDLLTQPDLLWGIPTILRDFDLINDNFATDPTLADGSSVTLLERPV